MLLLTEAEVAEQLRCKVTKVTRLRKTGKLPYLPGRPVMILQSDVTEYVERAKTPAGPRLLRNIVGKGLTDKQWVERLLARPKRDPRPKTAVATPAKKLKKAGTPK